MRSSTTLALAALLFAAAGCSGKATGTGGTSGSSGSSGSSSGGGVFGALKDGNGGSSGSSGSSGTETCAAQGGDDACTSCLKTSCCPSLRACGSNSACTGIFDCAEACADDRCYAQCIEAYPNGRVPLNTLLECAQGKCAAQCEISTTASGTEGPGPGGG
ncbi:MAG: hypothetical protein KF819_25785 [Labilithrix sp.]|nr:hypothetical protein [Labilithrix sp.]